MRISIFAFRIKNPTATEQANRDWKKWVAVSDDYSALIESVETIYLAEMNLPSADNPERARREKALLTSYMEFRESLETYQKTTHQILEDVGFSPMLKQVAENLEKDLSLLRSTVIDARLAALRPKHSEETKK